MLRTKRLACQRKAKCNWCVNCIQADCNSAMGLQYRFRHFLYVGYSRIIIKWHIRTEAVLPYGKASKTRNSRACLPAGRAGRLFKAFDNEAIGQKGLWSFMSFYIYSAIYKATNTMLKSRQPFNTNMQYKTN